MTTSRGRIRPGFCRLRRSFLRRRKRCALRRLCRRPRLLCRWVGPGLFRRWARPRLFAAEARSRYACPPRLPEGRFFRLMREPQEIPQKILPRADFPMATLPKGISLKAKAPTSITATETLRRRTYPNLRLRPKYSRLPFRFRLRPLRLPRRRWAGRGLFGRWVRLRRFAAGARFRRSLLRLPGARPCRLRILCGARPPENPRKRIIPPRKPAGAFRRIPPPPSARAGPTTTYSPPPRQSDCARRVRERPS